DEPDVCGLGDTARPAGLGGRARRAAGEEQPVPRRPEDDRPGRPGHQRRQQPVPGIHRHAGVRDQRQDGAERRWLGWAPAQTARGAALPPWFAALALVVPATVAAAVPARPGAVDWSRTVVKTPAGGFLMGNPKAKVKLVEYGSLACPHCRHFEE